MTHPAVDDLPEQATSTLLEICERLSMSERAGLARWASAASDALLVRLMSVSSGQRLEVVDFEPCGPLTQLDVDELDRLHTAVLDGAATSDDDAVVTWCTRMDRLIAADLRRRGFSPSPRV